MKRLFTMSGIVLLTVACVFFTACTQQVAEPEAAALTQAEAEAVARDYAETFDNAFSRGDVDALAQLYTDDARRYPPDGPPLIGNDAIRAGFEEFFEQNEGSNLGKVEKAIPAEDVMFVRGTWEGIGTPKAGGDPIEVSGYWMSVMRLQDDGSWKTSENMWVQDVPPPQE